MAALPSTPPPKGIERFPPRSNAKQAPTAVKAAGPPPARSLKEEACAPSQTPASPVPSADGSDTTSVSNMGWASTEKLEGKLAPGAYKIFVRGKVASGHYKDVVNPANPALSARYFWVRRDKYSDIIEPDEELTTTTTTTTTATTTTTTTTTTTGGGDGRSEVRADPPGERGRG